MLKDNKLKSIFAPGPFQSLCLTLFSHLSKGMKQAITIFVHLVSYVKLVDVIWSKYL